MPHKPLVWSSEPNKFTAPTFLGEYYVAFHPRTKTWWAYLCLPINQDEFDAEGFSSGAEAQKACQDHANQRIKDIADQLQNYQD